MTLESLAIAVVETTEAAAVDFMLVGAIAAGAYGVPRSTKDVDLLVAVNVAGGLDKVVQSLSSLVEFEPQVVFDTLTWGRRHVGQSRSTPPFKVELFELFDDPFVQEEFHRRQQVFVPMLGGRPGCPRPRMSSCESSAGAAAGIWTTRATCSPCKAPRRWTWPT